ncbi:MAG: trigger factor [Gemmatimonadaceae bacterium]
MDIQITTKKKDGVERLLEVSVPAQAVEDAEATATRRYASQVRLPGFRPGKAPSTLVRKKFGEAIRQQALEALVQEAYKEVVTREQLRPAAQPHVHDVKFETGKALTFELHVEVRPEVELARTSGFKVTRPASTVTDDQVREQIDALRTQKAAWTPITEKAQPGDTVSVLLASADDDGSMPEGKEYHIEIGAGEAIAGVEELIMTVTPGETAERVVRWPDDFVDEAQRGKSKTVRVTVQDVKRKTLPPLDDAFARELGEFDSVAALEKTVRGDLEKHAERNADAEVRQKLIDEIIGANPFEVPPSWVSELTGAYLQAYQVPEADQDRFGREFRPMAERQVRRDLVIDTIADREKLTASEADVDTRVSEQAEKRGVKPAQLYASLQKAGRLKEIERSITEEKVFEWLKSRNTIA